MPEIRSGGTRKWHSKSRKGCHACKARKVKCDEYRPSCRNCLKRATRCDFLDSDSTVSSTPTVPQTLELELLHNFTVSTAATLATEPQVWRVVVPQIGFETRYILDGVLALSAIHMARSDNRRREMLLSQATEHLNASLKAALPLIPSVSAQNCENMFLFSVLTLYINLASPRREDDMLLVGGDSIPQWLFLLRGITPLVCLDEEKILSSTVSLIFRTTEASFEFWNTHAPAQDEHLDELEAGIRSRTSNDEARQAVLVLAVQHLRRSYTFLSSNGFPDEARLRGFYTWLFEVSDDYLKLLKNLDSEALCVFAYFSVLMRELEKYWWAEGWGTHLIKRIYFLLDGEYRLYIRWPIERVGWVPPSRVG